MTDAPVPFHISATVRRSQPTITVAGELDLATAPLLEERLDVIIGDATADVAVDLSQVTFLDSSGLNVLAAAHQRLTTSGAQLVVVDASPFVLTALEVSGLDGFLVVTGRTTAADRRAAQQSQVGTFGRLAGASYRGVGLRRRAYPLLVSGAVDVRSRTEHLKVAGGEVVHGRYWWLILGSRRRVTLEHLHPHLARREHGVQVEGVLARVRGAVDCPRGDKHDIATLHVLDLARKVVLADASDDDHDFVHVVAVERDAITGGAPLHQHGKPRFVPGGPGSTTSRQVVFGR